MLSMFKLQNYAVVNFLLKVLASIFFCLKFFDLKLFLTMGLSIRPDRVLVISLFV
jgi:hypothetical protein